MSHRRERIKNYDYHLLSLISLGEVFSTRDILSIAQGFGLKRGGYTEAQHLSRLKDSFQNRFKRSLRLTVYKNRQLISDSGIPINRTNISSAFEEIDRRLTAHIHIPHRFSKKHD